MPNPQVKLQTYDSRWFIWTIVLLLVSGISLLSYIVISSENSEYQDIAALKSSVKK